MSHVRKEFFKRVSIIAICALVIMVVIAFEIQAPVSSVAIAGVFVALYQFLLLFIRAPEILDEFWPISKRNQGRTTTANKWTEQIILWSFFLSLLFEIYEGRTIENTIRGFHLFWFSALSGLTLAVIISILLKTFSPTLYFDSKRRVTVNFGLFVGCFLFMPALASFVNEKHFEGENCKSYNVIRKSIASSKLKEHWVFLDINGIEERFSVSTVIYNNVNVNDSLKLCTQKGILGYEVVKEFKPAN